MSEVGEMKRAEEKLFSLLRRAVDANHPDYSPKSVIYLLHRAYRKGDPSFMGLYF
jgi:hypothetical protein